MTLEQRIVALVQAIGADIKNLFLGKQDQDPKLDAIADLSGTSGFLYRTESGWGLNTALFARETQFATYGDVFAQPGDYWVNTGESTNFWAHSILYNDPAGFSRFVETYQSLPLGNNIIPDFNQSGLTTSPADSTTVNFDYIVDCGDSIL